MVHYHVGLHTKYLCEIEVSGVSCANNSDQIMCLNIHDLQLCVQPIHKVGYVYCIYTEQFVFFLILYSDDTQ